LLNTNNFKLEKTVNEQPVLVKSKSSQEQPEELSQAKLRHKSFHGLKSDSYVSSMNIDENSLLSTQDIVNQSSNNWQNYFNNKMSFSSSAKDKQTVRGIFVLFFTLLKLFSSP
jgi:hypothetical protein